MNREDVKDILTRYRTDTCTEAERQLVERWIVHGSADPLNLSDDQLLEDLLAIRLRLERDLRAKKTTKHYRILKWVPYAAAIVFILSVGFWLFRDQWTSYKQPSTVDQIADVAPGGNKATLTLADGRAINLSKEQSGIVVGDGVTYADGSALLNEDARSQFQQLTTPKGGTYRVTLSDGTRVWLNSATTLTYPVRFTNERIVKIAGEAYFEVARNHKSPFKVISKDQTLTVLGTAFNISAYSDENEVKTTVVEGSVRVAPASTASYPNAILTPGQQSNLSKIGITVDDVDVAAFIGWKEGFFIFNGTELRNAMKQLSRWYDVEVVYEGTIPRTPFYGKISRGDTLAEVLAILKEGKVNFRIEKKNAINRLIVMP